MIKWKQENAGFDDWGLDLKNPDFVALAESYGAHGHRVTSADEFAPLLAKCLDSNGTHVIEVPFSYDWMSAELEETQKEMHHIIEKVEKEFGACLIDCSESHGSWRLQCRGLDVKATPPQHPQNNSHDTAPALSKWLRKTKHQKLVSSRERLCRPERKLIAILSWRRPLSNRTKISSLRTSTPEKSSAKLLWQMKSCK